MTRRLLLVAAAGTVLWACAGKPALTPEQQLAADRQYCEQAGEELGSEQFDRCVVRQDDERRAAVIRAEMNRRCVGQCAYGAAIGGAIGSNLGNVIGRTVR